MTSVYSFENYFCNNFKILIINILKIVIFWVLNSVRIY